MIFQIYDLLFPLVAKASTVRYGAGKAEARNLNMENCLPNFKPANENAVIYKKKAPLSRGFLHYKKLGDFFDFGNQEHQVHYRHRHNGYRAYLRAYRIRGKTH